MTLFQLYNEGRHVLEKTGNPDADQDARLLLLAAFKLEPVHYLLNRMQDMTDCDANRFGITHYREMIEKRRKRYPLQQIVGSQEFMGFTFEVNKHVLIPRQDTETLVELVLDEQKDPDKRLLDLCTGSGCIAISLARMGNYRSVTAVDISKEALLVAGRNLRQICGDQSKGTFALLWGDLFGALHSCPPDEQRFDIITVNPPYIPTAVIETLEPEVKDFEPVLALDGDSDGLRFYRILAREAKDYLEDNGTIYMEIGYDQGAAVSRLFCERGYQNVRVVKDLQHNDRIVCAEWRNDLR